MRTAERARDEVAFRAVYADQFAPMVRLAYVTTGSVAAAEDVAQDVFAELYRHWSGITDPVPWLRRAVVNRCTSWVRRRVVERRYAPRTPRVAELTEPPGPEAVAMRAALARLRPRYRAALFLRYYLDLPEAEIAAALRCRPGTVKSLLHRGLAVLKEYVDEH